MLIVNFQSIWGKKEELKDVLLQNNIDIVIGSESHLDPSISNSEFLPPSYTAFRRDREDGWGGVIIITKSELDVEEVIKPTSCEIIAVKIEPFQKPIIVAACYRPPKGSVKDAEVLSHEINKLSTKYKNNPLWLGGDLNLPDIDWSVNSIKGNQYTKAINETFLDGLDCANLAN